MGQLTAQAALDKKGSNFWSRQYKRIIIITVFAVLFVTSLFVGALKGISLPKLLAGDKLAWDVMLHSRIPRTVAIVLAAAGLSVAGLIMQAISRNKFMSPTTSGTIDAAALGMLISTVALGTAPKGVQAVFSFVFALAATLLFTSVINRLKIKDAVYIPLVGMMYGGLIAAITTALAYRLDALQLLEGFKLGSFAKIGGFGVVYIIAVPLVLSVIYSSRFSIIGLGEDFAKNLGLNYNRVVFLGLVLVALISAASFVAVGPLPFVGLIIPNLVTTIYGDNLKKSIFDIMLMGGSFVLLSDIISRLVIYPFEVSVTLTISVLGGIIFMIFLIRAVRNGK